MTNKLTLEEKIEKTLEYCKYIQDDDNYFVHFQVEIENTDGETKTERKCAGSEYKECTTDISVLQSLIGNAVVKAYLNSEDFNNLYTVRVWIQKYKDGYLVDEEPVDDYEINFENGIEV